MFDINWLKDPTVFKVNRLAAHSNHSFVGKNGKSFTKSLNGMWKFFYAQTLDKMPDNAQALTLNDTKWDSITVPSVIQLQGNGKYGIPHYVNTMYPWDGHEEIVPGEIPQNYNPVGIYRKAFTLDESWDKNKVFIRFDGVDVALALWCNGEFVGYSEDTFTPSEFALGKFLQEGENLLCAKVFRFSSASWIEDQDFWRFSGIFRDVTLFTVPQTHAWDIFLKPVLSKDFKKGKLNLEVKFEGEGKAELCFNNERTTKSISQPLTTISLDISEPRLWSGEDPYLYDGVLNVYDNENILCETVNLKIGFRKFEIKNGVMCLNGKRIVFKGVNRHEWNCKTARTLSYEDMLWDVKNMKQNNINAVRTSHYPNNTQFYDLCDEYGIYVVDEANLESHGTWQKRGGVNVDEHTVPNDNPYWLEAVVDRGANMLQRDKNHPSILVWSCGNESCGGKDIFMMSEYFRTHDQSRLVHYEGVCHDRRYNKTSDIESWMYLPVVDIKKYLAEHRDKPFICCEYSHAMANSSGGLFKYTQLTDEEPLYQGGFIWDYIDQGLLAIGADGKEYFAYGGDYGDTPSDYNFCMNGLVYPNRINSPKMQEVKTCYQNIDIKVSETEVLLTNKFLFQNLQKYGLTVVYSCDGKEIARETVKLQAEPEQTEKIPLHFEKATKAGVYTVFAFVFLQKNTNFADKGFVIASGEKVFKVKTEEKSLTTGKITVARGDLNVGIHGADFDVMFTKGAGGLVAYSKNKQQLLGSIFPRLNFWRASTDNDRGNDFARSHVKWLAAGQFAKVETLTVENTDTTAKVTCLYRLPMAEEGVQLVYTIQGDGSVNVCMTWLGGKETVPEFGMLFCLPAQYDKVKYFGRGPDENYIDRKTGAFLGQYEYAVADNVSNYPVPQECGNRTEVYKAQVINNKKSGIVFTADGMEFSALPFTPQEMEQARHIYDLPQNVKTVVRCMLQQTGVGGDDSWGAKTHEEFITTVDNGTSFNFTFKGI